MASPPAVRLRSPQPPDRTRATFSWFLLIMANVLWAASYIVSKFVLFETSVTIMLALRMGISSLSAAWFPIFPLVEVYGVLPVICSLCWQFWLRPFLPFVGRHCL